MFDRGKNPRPPGMKATATPKQSLGDNSNSDGEPSIKDKNKSLSGDEDNEKSADFEDEEDSEDRVVAAQDERGHW